MNKKLELFGQLSPVAIVYGSQGYVFEVDGRMTDQVCKDWIELMEFIKDSKNEAFGILLEFDEGKESLYLSKNRDEWGVDWYLMTYNLRPAGVTVYGSQKLSKDTPGGFDNVMRLTRGLLFDRDDVRHIRLLDVLSFRTKECEGV